MFQDISTPDFIPKIQPWTFFSTPDFSAMNSLTLNCSRTTNMVQEFIVAEFMVEEFMVEEFMVEEYMVEEFIIKEFMFE